MNNLLTLLGNRTAELKDLIFVPEQSLYSWFVRKSILSSAYDSFLSGFKIYYAKHEQEDLITIYTKWETSPKLPFCVCKKPSILFLKAKKISKELNWYMDVM